MAKSKKQSAAVPVPVPALEVAATPQPQEATVAAVAVVTKPVQKKKKAAAVTVGASLADAFAQSAAFFGKKATYASAEPELTPEQTSDATNDAKSKKKSGEPKPPKRILTEAESVERTEKRKKKKKDKKRKLDETTEEEESAVQEEEETSTSTTTTDAVTEGAEEMTPATEVEQVTEAGTGVLLSPDQAKSARTIFVGNVSLDATQASLKQFFTPCGKVESVRLRFLPVAGTAVNDHGNQKLMMKVCANKKIFTDKRDFCHAYVTFAELASIDKALKMNHALFLDKKLRIDHENPVVDPQRSVFVGNLSFHVTDEAVWSFFDKELKTDEEPHPVENVRVIRDRDTGAGKGFGYVLLKGKALAAKALSLAGKKLERRDLRVQVCGKRTKNKKGEDEKLKHEGRRAASGAGKRVSLKRQTQPEATLPPLIKKAKFTEGLKATAPTNGKKPKASATAATVGKASKFAGKKFEKKTGGSGKKVDGKAKKFDGKKGAKGKKLDGKKTPKAPFVKAKKPKHEARKARQAAEAAAKK